MSIFQGFKALLVAGYEKGHSCHVMNEKGRRKEHLNKSTVVLCSDRWTRAAANHGVPSRREPFKVPS